MPPPPGFAKGGHTFFKVGNAPLGGAVKYPAPIAQTLVYRRSYIVNCKCTFICHALEKLRKFVHELKHQSEIKNTITINLDRERIN